MVGEGEKGARGIPPPPPMFFSLHLLLLLLLLFYFFSCLSAQSPVMYIDDDNTPNPL